MDTSTRRISRYFCVLFALIAAAGACGGSQSIPPTEVDTPEAPAEPAPNAAGASVNGKGPSGTLVVLEPLFEHEFARATAPAYMDQTGLEFIPDLLTAQIGQAVRFRNNDDVLHNVRVQETGTGVPVFNVATTPHNSYDYAFEKPGYYNVGCDIHASMRAMVLVTATPYVSTADGAGQFAFAGVVPGRYKVIWFENGEEQQKQVEIRESSTHVALP
jgi:plastocyanin